MNQQAFDTFTRLAAEGVTRRSSLATLGGAGLAALVGSSLTVEAKNDKKKTKKKIKKKSNQKCKKQAEDCRRFIAEAGGNAAAIACCDFLATCNFPPFIPCVNEND